MSARGGAGARSELRTGDLGGLAVLGLRGRPTRTLLSALGVALGVATVVGVLGISSSSRSQLVAEIDALGTNLLTVTPSQSFSDQSPTLPSQATEMVARIGPVLGASALGEVGANVNAYRNDRVSPANTNAISVVAAGPQLLATLQGGLAAGAFLNRATEHLPAAVLGADAAGALGIDRAGSAQVWLGNHWFTVVGILRPLQLAPELDRSVLVGFPVARQLLGSDGLPVEIYVRTDPQSVDAVEAVLAASADPAAPQDVMVSNPTDVLVARVDATAAFDGLLLALGAVALVVGGVGIANVMVIAVLERRSEIGLRRALGATRRHIGAQFVAESTLLAALGGTIGALLGVAATGAYASARHWHATLPPAQVFGAVATALLVGAVAGLYPAHRAAKVSPSLALRAA